MKQVAKGLVRVLLSLLFTSAAIAGPQTYYLLAPETFSGSVSVVSLEPDNVITAGNYQLVLNQYQRASIPSSVLSSGIAISGTKSFSLGTASDATDLLVPQAFAGTAFIVPHLGGQDRFHVLSTAPGGAQVTVQNGSGTQVVSVPLPALTRRRAVIGPRRLSAIRMARHTTMMGIMTIDQSQTFIITFHAGIGR